MMDLEESLKACLEANLKIIFLVLIGIILTYSGHLDQKGVSDLGTITYYVSLPALIFTNVGSKFNIDDLNQLWILPVSAMVYVVVGYVFGFVFCAIGQVPAEERSAVQAAMMFGNTGALAIALVSSLTAEAVPESHRELISGMAVSYIALFIVGQNLIMFSWGEYLLGSYSSIATPPSSFMQEEKQQQQQRHEQLKDEDDDYEVEDLQRGILIQSKSQPNFADPRYGAILNEDEQDDVVIRNRRRSATVVQQFKNRSNFSTFKLRRESSIPADLFAKAVSRMPVDSLALVDPSNTIKDHERFYLLKAAWAVLVRIFQSPPLIAAMAGLIFATVPFLHDLLFVKDAPLDALRSALVSVGRMQVPASMIMLSGAGTIRIMERLHEGELEFHFSKASRFIILFGRAVTMGLFGFAWYELVTYLGLVDREGMEPFVIFLESIVPSAQNVVMLLLVHGNPNQGRAMAVVILEQYAVTIPFLTLYLVLSIQKIKPFPETFPPPS